MHAHAAWFMALGAACGTTAALILGLNRRAGLAHKNAMRAPVLLCAAFTEFDAAAALLGGTDSIVTHFAFGASLGYGVFFGWRMRVQPFGGKTAEKIAHTLGAPRALFSTVAPLGILRLLIMTP